MDEGNIDGHHHVHVEHRRRGMESDIDGDEEVSSIAAVP